MTYPDVPPEPDLEFVVLGQPKPKGSLRHVGHGRLIEQVEGSRPWREAVKWAAIDSLTGSSLVGVPVRVEATVTVPRPQSAPRNRRIWPITRRSGDVDKHCRNIFDALVDAAVMADDSQVVEVTIRKTFPDEHVQALPCPGAVIQIWQVTC